MNAGGFLGLEGSLGITESSFLIFLGTEDHRRVRICPISFLEAELVLMSLRDASNMFGNINTGC